MRLILRAAALAIFTYNGAAPARAAFLTENLAGFFGPTSTLGGVAFGADTAFTLQAVGDTSSDVTVVPGLDTYAITSLTISIAGKGTFTAIPDFNTRIFLADLNLDPFYQVGLVNSTTSGGFGAAFSNATPGFNAATPTSSTLSNFLFYTISGPYQIALTGVTGGLVVNDIGSGAQTASILVGVPEPASLAMTTLGLVGALGYDWRRSKLRSWAKFDV